MKNIIFLTTLFSLIFLSFKNDPPVKNHINYTDILEIEENGLKLAEVLKAVDQAKKDGIPLDNILVGLVSNCIEDLISAEKYAMKLKKEISSASESSFHITEEMKNTLVKQYGLVLTNLLLHSHESYMNLLENSASKDELLKFWENELNALYLNKNISRNDAILLANIYKSRQVFINHKLNSSFKFTCVTIAQRNRCLAQAQQAATNALAQVNNPTGLCGAFTGSGIASCLMREAFNSAYSSCCSGSSLPVNNNGLSCPTFRNNCSSAGGTVTNRCNGTIIFSATCNGEILRCCR